MAITWEGGWTGVTSSSISYYTGDVISHNNIVYSVKKNVAVVPIGSPSPDLDMSNWDVFASGANGTSGSSGTSGGNGSSGSSGNSGTSGSSGNSGTNGSSGTSGVNGTSGSSGANGTSGSSGSSGSSGTTGSSGSSGTTGSSGTSGSSGSSGTSGSTPTYVLNWNQAGGGTKVTLGASSSAQTIVSTTITSTGNPVRVTVYGDVENSGAGYWCKLQLYRNSTPIGAIVHAEGSSNSENSPFSLSHIDAVSAGAQTYYLKAIEIQGGNISFGESVQPIINVEELNGPGSSGTSGSSGNVPVTGSWNLTTGANTVSFTVPAGQSYVMWVNGNIPNGIVNWNATVTLSNSNVPVIGSQYGWYYLAGNALVLTSIPSQIVGTLGSIITTMPSVTNSNTFTFGITNNSGSSQIVYYGYIKVS